MSLSSQSKRFPPDQQLMVFYKFIFCLFWFNQLAKPSNSINLNSAEIRGQSCEFGEFFSVSDYIYLELYDSNSDSKISKEYIRLLNPTPP